MRPRTAQDAMTIDRVIALLAGLSLVSVFLLSSQSGASFSTYTLALIVLVAGTPRWRAFARTQALAGLMIGFLLYFSSSVWWSSELSARGAFSIYARCALILTFVVALSTSLTRVPDFAKWLARAVAISGGVAACAALIEFLLHPTFDGRLVGLGQLRNSVVAALSFDAALLFALSVAFTDSARWRVVATVSAASIGLAIFATGSRAGYLGAAAGVWVTLVTWCSTTPRQVVCGLSLPLLSAIGIGIVAFAVRPEFSATLFPRGDSFRLEIWSAEWQRLVGGGPMFGLGILTSDDVAIDGRQFSHPHNLYLATALQGGLVGLLLLLGLLACTAWGLVRNLGQSVARLGLALLTAGMCAYAFDGWELIDKVGLSWLLLWVPVAVATAVGATSNGESARDMVDLNSRGRSSDATGREP